MISDNHVSRRLRSAALASIDNKRGVLRRWSQKGVPLRCAESPELDWYPTSLRTFCAWDGSQNADAVRKQLEAIHRNSYEALAADPERLRDVRTLLGLVEQKAVRARKRLDPKIAAKEANVEVEIERDKRRGALLGYRRARQEAQEFRRKLQDEERAHKETTCHFQEQLKQREVESADLRRQVAELTATLRKATPIRPVK